MSIIYYLCKSFLQVTNRQINTSVTVPLVTIPMISQKLAGEADIIGVVGLNCSASGVGCNAEGTGRACWYFGCSL